MKPKHLAVSVGLLLALVELSSCAPVGYTRQAHGFISGLIHGFIFLFALIGKLFGMHHGLYASHNTGLTYWLGFIIGFAILGSGGFFSRR